jgi:hypothetical protein
MFLSVLNYDAKMQPSHDPVDIRYTCKTGQGYCFFWELNMSERFHPYIRRLYAMMAVIRHTNTKRLMKFIFFSIYRN